MYTTRGEICIKTPSGMYCSSSPIQDCGCGRQSGFRDPFEEVPETLGEDALPEAVARRQLLERLAALVERADPSELQSKANDVIRVVKLLLLREVKTAEPFVITALGGQAPRDKK